MSPARFALLTLVFMLAAAIFAACSSLEPTPAPKRVSVQDAWQEARALSGHRVHVTTKQIACNQCHQLTGDAVGKALLERCASCHERETKIRHGLSHADAGAQVADCTACHAFSRASAERNGATLPAFPGAVPSPAPLPSGSAQARHASIGTPPPHPAYAPTECARCHSKTQGQTAAVTIHGTSECVSCHRPHDDAAPKPGDCRSCHAMGTQHAVGAKTPTEACTTCHEHQHASAEAAAKACATCHAQHKPLVPASALFAGHDRCAQCHEPHGSEPRATKPCRSCHQTTHALAEARVPAHGACANCHQPHAVRGSAQAACVRCHAQVRPDHPGSAGHTCTSCHDPHPDRASQTAASCSSCHHAAHDDRAFHAGIACTNCHTPHAFNITRSNSKLCSGCHATEVTRVVNAKGHQDCASCHGGLPHDPHAAGAPCGSCHAVQHQAVRPGHQACTQCHEPHAGSVAAPCGSCHGAQAHSAPKGHADCASCHEPHAGTQASGSCDRCHAPQARSKHGALAEGCSSCHRPHGPKGPASPPSCESCHAKPQLSGLHQVERHSGCRDCHSGHGNQPGIERKLCLSCHQDRREHFPTASRCANCHLFRPAVKAP